MTAARSRGIAPPAAARRSLLLAAALCCLPLAGCERVFRNMYDQPKLKPLATSPLFVDGEASRPPPPGAVARATGEAAMSASGRRGEDAPLRLDAADDRTALPSPVPPALVERGRERYEIYCVPCHSRVGDGDGPVVRRGYPSPGSLREARLRAASDRHLFDVIGRGWGVMLPYAGHIDAADRWAVVAYVRVLQRDIAVTGTAMSPSTSTGPGTGPVANDGAAGDARGAAR